MLKFVPDHLKIKNMCKNAQYKAQEMCDKVILENSGTLMFVPNCQKNKKICNKAIGNYTHTLEFDPGCYKTNKMCNKVVDISLSAK